MVFSDETFRRYVDVARMRGDWQAIIDSSAAEYVLWSKNRPRQVAHLMASRRWRLLYEDFASLLLVRSDLAPRGPWQPTPDSAWRDLALAETALQDDRSAEAEEHFERAVDAMPGLIEACWRLALVQEELGKAAEQRATLERCLRAAPDANSHGLDDAEDNAS